MHDDDFPLRSSRLMRLTQRLPTSLEGRVGTAIIVLIFVDVARFAIELLHELVGVLRAVAFLPLEVVRAVAGWF